MNLNPFASDKVQSGIKKIIRSLDDFQDGLNSLSANPPESNKSKREKENK